MQNANELTHYGVKGMKWGVRKVKSLQKEAARNVARSKSHKRDADRVRFEERAYKKKIDSGRASAGVNTTTRNSDGSYSTTTGKGDVERYRGLRESRIESDEAAAHYEKRAKLALKRAAGKKLNSADLAEKHEIYKEKRNIAIGLGFLSVATAIAAPSGPSPLGFMSNLLLLGSAGTFVKANLDDREIKK